MEIQPARAFSLQIGQTVERILIPQMNCEKGQGELDRPIAKGDLHVAIRELREFVLEQLSALQNPEVWVNTESVLVTSRSNP